ncbi:hypothetical protein AAG570_003046 [Ranatra chinensis]|uniref:Uncharacterized protein n=1 Tax=Ranatra chinensis TaxID=642074 RepID=A0ABD0Y7U5_9HEMI
MGRNVCSRWKPTPSAYSRPLWLQIGALQGNYTIKDMNTKQTVNLAFAPPKLYRLDFAISHAETGKRVGCKRFTVEIPKKKDEAGLAHVAVAVDVTALGVVAVVEAAEDSGENSGTGVVVATVVGLIVLPVTVSVGVFLVVTYVGLPEVTPVFYAFGTIVAIAFRMAILMSVLALWHFRPLCSPPSSIMSMVLLVSIRMHILFPKYFLDRTQELAFSYKVPGPDGFIVRQLSECEDRGTDEFVMVGNRIRRVNRTTYSYTGTFVLPRKVDDDYKMSVIAAEFGNGGWKMSKAGFDLGGVCTLMKTYIPKMMKQFLGDKFGIPPPYCPIPAGNYTVTDVNTYLKMDIPFVPYGRFRLDFVILHSSHNRRLGCKRALVEFLEKKLQRGWGGGGGKRPVPVYRYSDVRLPGGAGVAAIPSSRGGGVRRSRDRRSTVGTRVVRAREALPDANPALGGVQTRELA